MERNFEAASQSIKKQQHFYLSILFRSRWGFKALLQSLHVLKALQLVAERLATCCVGWLRARKEDLSGDNRHLINEKPFQRIWSKETNLFWSVHFCGLIIEGHELWSVWISHTFSRDKGPYQRHYAYNMTLFEILIRIKPYFKTEALMFNKVWGADVRSSRFRVD